MSRKRRSYPQLGTTRKIDLKKHRIKCDAITCKYVAQNRVEVEVSYMRGDDEVFTTCNHHLRMAREGKWNQFYREMPEQ